MKKSNRLDIILRLINQKKYKYIWDVGTDHGLIPFFLSESKIIKKIWASDISVSAINILKAKNKPLNNIEYLISDGLTQIKKKVDVVIIAGIGAKNILEILQKDNQYIQNYIIQTNINPKIIRKWCLQNQFTLEEENIIWEKKHYYQTILINKKKNLQTYKPQEMLFGPILLKKKEQIFFNYWKEILAKEKTILQKVTSLVQKKERKEKVKWIEEILKTENAN